VVLVATGGGSLSAAVPDRREVTVLRRLVVNADDLGLTVGVNDGIFDAHDHGILTSASLFAGARATSDAIRRLRSRPSLGVGAHLALVDGTPTLPPLRIPTLLDDDGRFRRSWKPFIVACLLGKVSLAEVELELTAQIEQLRSAGVRLTHLDAHQHVHAYPPVFAIVARLAARFGIPVVRVPYERPSLIVGDSHSRGTTHCQAVLNMAMRPWACRDYPIAALNDLRAPQFVGRIHTGALSMAAFAAIVRTLRPGVTELMVHPGYTDDELERTGTRLLQSRQDELDLLCRLDARALVVGERVDLVRHDLTHVKRSLRKVS
jgi:chitin disaccharide deacetylase